MYGFNEPEIEAYGSRRQRSRKKSARDPGAA